MQRDTTSRACTVIKLSFEGREDGASSVQTLTSTPRETPAGAMVNSSLLLPESPNTTTTHQHRPTTRTDKQKILTDDGVVGSGLDIGDRDSN